LIFAPRRGPLVEPIVDWQRYVLPSCRNSKMGWVSRISLPFLLREISTFSSTTIASALHPETMVRRRFARIRMPASSANAPTPAMTYWSALIAPSP